jgi:NhaP-type Na+/H+ or K+/H+ antiporter
METAFGLIAVVLIVSALASGLVERGPLSFPMLFLGLGILLSGAGLEVLEIGPHDPTLEVIATVSLALVLFLDAVQLRFDEVGEDWRTPMLALGPGTLLTIAIVAVAAALLVDTSLVESLLLGTILASTDPVVLRDVLRDRRIPRSVRRALRVEAGTNDIVVLPAVLILIAVANETAGGVVDWILFLAKLLLIGPVAGVVVGGVGAWLMSRADEKYAIRREYQALYGIGLVLAAYFAGDAVGGDGFLAAFTAGVAVTMFNFELCDCFLEYGEVTAEMAMLFAFVLFGAVLTEIVDLVSLLPALVFAVLVITVARPMAFGTVLRHATMSRSARAFIAWFGPRGLASLLLALLVVDANVANAERLLAITGIVALVSVSAHGISATPLTALYARHLASATLNEEREATASGLFQHGTDAAKQVPRISVDALHQLLQAHSPPIVLDVRTRSQFDAGDARIPGSIRVLPDLVAEWATGQSRERSIVAYCT